MTTRMPTAISSLLKTSLDRLYAEFNYPDSATDPIHIVRRFERARRPRNRRILRRGARVRPGRERAAVDRAAARGRRPGPGGLRAVVRGRGRRATSRASATGGSARTISSALIAILRGMLDRSGSIERFFAEGYEAGAPDVGAALDSFSTARALAHRSPVRAGASKGSPGVCYFFPRPSAGIRVQAAESVSALDGPPRRARSRRVDERPAVSARRAARHARHPGRPLPRPDALHQPRLGDGPGDHRRAAGPRRRAIR